MTATTNTNPAKRRGSVWTAALVVLNLAAFNLICQEHYARWDLTETSIYTLSGDTVDVLRNLEDLVTIKAYISKDLPPGYEGFRRDLLDQLREFKNAAGDQLSLVIHEMGPADRDRETEAQGYGIAAGTLYSLRSGRTEAMAAYTGIAVLYHGRVQSIPFVDTAMNLEYDLLMKIARVLRETPMTVAFQEVPNPDPNAPPEVQAQMESRRVRRNRHSIEYDFRLVADYFRQGQYQVTTVDLSGPVPQDVTVLVLANLQLMDETAQYFADQFLMRGGKLVVLHSGVRADESNYTARPGREPIDEWLAHYGSTINRDLILDANSIVIPFTARAEGGTFQKKIKYPPCIRLLQAFFNKKHPITASLGNDMLARFCSSVDLTPPEAGEATVLIKSSIRAWQQKDVFEIHPDRIVDPGVAGYSQFPIAGLVEGTFSSYFATRPILDEIRQKAKVLQGRSGQFHYTARPAGGSGGGANPAVPPADGESTTAEEGAVPEAIEGAAGLPPGAPPGMRLQSEETAILVIGCDSFISEPPMTALVSLERDAQEAFVSGYAGCRQFFANAVDYLAFGGGFSRIRARDVYIRYFDPKFEDRPGAFKVIELVGTLGSAALVMVLGLVVLARRRQSDKKKVVL